eukprot:GEMP01012929.1.p1 GENE.GEMP01012929.1~~GEMP01012929.1.p1  ORF type:complete len:270 (+),score=59.48 GEMP01012929.1:121-930(+)
MSGALKRFLRAEPLVSHCAIRRRFFAYPAHVKATRKTVPGSQQALWTQFVNQAHAPQLWYFEHPGRGELSRLILHASCTEFTEHTVPLSDWNMMKRSEGMQWDKFFRALPLLVHGEVELAQSIAIAGYIAETFLYPSQLQQEPLTPGQRAKDNLFLQTQQEFLDSMFQITFSTKRHRRKQLVDAFRQESEQALTTLNRLTPDVGYVNNTSDPTLADFVLLDMATSSCPNATEFGVDFAKYPNLQRVVNETKTYNPTLEAYLAARADKRG